MCKRSGLFWIAAFMPLVTSCGSKAPPEPQPITLSPEEKAFEAMMNGADLIGSFTVIGRTSSKLNEEKYSIARVEKMAGGLWNFHVRMQYGGKDIPFAMPFRVVWAGDTPMVTLTDLTIPGVGTFSARVLFYRDKYAGTWSHGKTGGHLFGRISRPNPAGGVAPPAGGPER